MANSRCRLRLCILCNIMHTPLLVITVQMFQRYFGPVSVQNKLWKLFHQAFGTCFSGRSAWKVCCNFTSISPRKSTCTRNSSVLCRVLTTRTLKEVCQDFWVLLKNLKNTLESQKILKQWFSFIYNYSTVGLFSFRWT